MFSTSGDHSDSRMAILRWVRLRATLHGNLFVLRSIIYVLRAHVGPRFRNSFFVGCYLHRKFGTLDACPVCEHTDW